MTAKLKKIKKTVIFTGYQCNNNCVFCCNLHKRDFPSQTTRQIIKEMMEAHKRGATYLEIIGGEQTIRPDIMLLVKAAKRIGFRTIAMATNGRKFSDMDFARKIIGNGLNHIIFSIHGHNSKLHDSLTSVKGSFRELLAGVDNVKTLGLKDLASNTIVVKRNYKYIPDIGKVIHGLGIANAEFIFVDPTRGGAYDNFAKLVPRLKEAAPYIKECLKFGRKKRFSHWHIRYVPVCLFRGYEDQISELYEARTFSTEHLAPDFKNFDVEASRKEIGRIKPPKCESCRDYGRCEGIWLEYYRRYGDKELVPLKGE